MTSIAAPGEAAAETVVGVTTAAAAFSAAKRTDEVADEPLLREADTRGRFAAGVLILAVREEGSLTTSSVCCCGDRMDRIFVVVRKANRRAEDRRSTGLLRLDMMRAAPAAQVPGRGKNNSQQADRDPKNEARNALLLRRFLLMLL